MSFPPYLRMLPITLCLVGLAWGFFELANARADSADKDLDHRFVEVLRQPDNPARMIGPPQLEEAMRDFTALGGYAVLVTTFLGFSIFAFAELGTRTFHFFWLTTFGGFWMGAVVDDDLGTELGQILNDGLTDSTIAAGDDGDFALEQVG